MAPIREFRGCGTALVTPFKSDGRLDEKTLLKLVDLQLDAGIDFLVPCGSTGESATLAAEEQARVVELVIQRAKGRVPVLAGAGGNNTARVVETAKRMAGLGADGILSVTPYYNRPSQEGLVLHFKTVAESIPIPVVLYNVPSRTGVNLLPGTVKRLSEIENIVGIKEASGNISQIAELVTICPDSLKIISGDDAVTLPVIALGGVGLISVISNEAPKMTADFVHLCLEGRFRDALVLQRKMLRLMQLNFIDTNPVPVKAAMARMGLIEECYRLPMAPLSPEMKEKLFAALLELGLIK
jgi:4-hydroxy-tetrahydrodipicolinate synthase